jgi:RimJ/RimL family protein N-acetyltransferase
MGQVGGAMTSRLAVRPFADRAEYARMVDYFLGADHAFLWGMGIDPALLPQREAWLDSVMRDHASADAEKERAYLAWIHDGKIVGHSSVSKMAIGEHAYIHLHLWDAALRRAGLGRLFFAAAAAEFMRTLRLKRLYCEPSADNPAPNRVLPQCGFRFVKRYRTTPGNINFEQEVNLYVLEGTPAG